MTKHYTKKKTKQLYKQAIFSHDAIILQKLKKAGHGYYRSLAEQALTNDSQIKRVTTPEKEFAGLSNCVLVYKAEQDILAARFILKTKILLDRLTSYNLVQIATSNSDIALLILQTPHLLEKLLPAEIDPQTGSPVNRHLHGHHLAEIAKHLAAAYFILQTDNLLQRLTPTNLVAFATANYQIALYILKTPNLLSQLLPEKRDLKTGILINKYHHGFDLAKIASSHFIVAKFMLETPDLLKRLTVANLTEIGKSCYESARLILCSQEFLKRLFPEEKERGITINEHLHGVHLAEIGCSNVNSAQLILEMPELKNKLTSSQMFDIQRFKSWGFRKSYEQEGDHEYEYTRTNRLSK